MPLQKRMELIRPNVFQPRKEQACREKLDRTDVYVRAWRPALPFFPRHNLKATLYDLKKPFYPAFMYEKPDMTKIMTEEYRRMWNIESLKFLAGVDIRERSRLPRRPFVKYGQFRTYKKNRCGFCYMPRRPLDLCECHCECEKPCVEQTNFHRHCTRDNTYKPFKARPVPCCVLKKKKGQKKFKKERMEQCTPPMTLDCSMIFEKDMLGNDICKVDYGSDKINNNYQYSNNCSGNTQNSSGYSLSGGRSNGGQSYDNNSYDNNMYAFVDHNNVRNIIYNTENCYANNYSFNNDTNNTDTKQTVFRNFSNICPDCPASCIIEDRPCPSCPACNKPGGNSCPTCTKPKVIYSGNPCSKYDHICPTCNNKKSSKTFHSDDEIASYVPCRGNVCTRSNNIECINRFCCFKNNPITGHCCTDNNRIYNENISVKKVLQMPKLTPIPLGTTFNEVCLQKY